MRTSSRILSLKRVAIRQLRPIFAACAVDLVERLTAARARAAAQRSESP